MKQIPIQRYLMEFAPTFCWCTRLDLFKLVEQIDENVSWESFKITMFKMHKDGKFISRIDPTPNRSKFEHTDPIRSVRSNLTKQYLLKPWRRDRAPVLPIPFKRIPTPMARQNTKDKLWQIL